MPPHHDHYTPLMCFYETQHPIQQEAQSSAPHSSPLLPNALPQDLKVPPAKSDHSSILAHAPSTLVGESNPNPSPELQPVCPGAQGRNLLEDFWVQQPESNSLFPVIIPLATDLDVVALPSF